MNPESPIILYKLASRFRPVKMLACIDNIREQSTRKGLIVLSLDDDDPFLRPGASTAQVIRSSILDRVLSDHPIELLVFYGSSGSKVKAINRDIPMDRPWDILVNTSDDMWMTCKGFDQRIIALMQHYWPDGDGVLHLPDGSSEGRQVMTLSIEGRKYFERFGYIYHPDYTSLWCDNEATEVAKRLGKYVFVDEQLFEHRHPVHGKAPTDAQYAYTESFFHQDNAVFIRREAAAFPK